MVITLALLHREKGRGSIPPTHASRRHADKVDTTMLVPAPRIQQDIYAGLVSPQPRSETVASSRSRRKCGGIDYVMNSSVLEDRAKGPLQ